MVRKWILGGIFLVGLSIFLYPILANMVSTTAHLRVIDDYSKEVSKMNEEDIEKERKKASEHNEKLKDSQLDFVDPFGDESDDESSNSVGNRSYYDALNIGPAIGSLEVPGLRVRLPIYHGTSSKVLSKGVGHLENSSLPTGEPGTHSVFTAHRGLPSSKLFRDLDKVEKGDLFFVNVLDEKYAYEVFEIDIVLPHQTEWLQMNDDEEIVTLLTCDPYMINSHRMLVKGKRVAYDPDSQDIPLPDGENYEYIFFIISGLLLLIFLVLIWRRKSAGENK